MPRALKNVEDPDICFPPQQAATEGISEKFNQAVDAAKQVSQRVREMPDRAKEIGGQIRQRAQELGKDARATAEDLREKVGQQMLAAREQTRQLADQKPFHLIAGVAVAAFCIGIGLRIWRSS